MDLNDPKVKEKLEEQVRLKRQLEAMKAARARSIKVNNHQQQPGTNFAQNANPQRSDGPPMAQNVPNDPAILEKLEEQANLRRKLQAMKAAKAESLKKLGHVDQNGNQSGISVSELAPNRGEEEIYKNLDNSATLSDKEFRIDAPAKSKAELAAEKKAEKEAKKQAKAAKKRDKSKNRGKKTLKAAGAGAGMTTLAGNGGFDVLKIQNDVDALNAKLAAPAPISSSRSTAIEVPDVPGAERAALQLYSHDDRDQLKGAHQLINMYFKNIYSDPANEKFVRIRWNNSAFQGKIVPIDSAVEFMKAMGFVKEYDNELGEYAFKLRSASKDLANNALNILHRARATHVDKNKKILDDSKDAKVNPYNSPETAVKMIEAADNLKKQEMASGETDKAQVISELTVLDSIAKEPTVNPIQEKEAQFCAEKIYANNDQKSLKTTHQLLNFYMKNIASHPDDPKYTRIRWTNEIFQKSVARVDGALDFLYSIGFEKMYDNDIECDCLKLKSASADLAIRAREILHSARVKANDLAKKREKVETDVKPEITQQEPDWKAIKLSAEEIYANGDIRKAARCSTFIEKLLENIQSDPTNLRYTKINSKMRQLVDDVLPVNGARKFLEGFGFKEVLDDSRTGKISLYVEGAQVQYATKALEILVDARIKSIDKAKGENRDRRPKIIEPIAKTAPIEVVDVTEISPVIPKESSNTIPSLLKGEESAPDPPIDESLADALNEIKPIDETKSPKPSIVATEVSPESDIGVAPSGLTDVNFKPPSPVTDFNFPQKKQRYSVDFDNMYGDSDDEEVSKTFENVKSDVQSRSGDLQNIVGIPMELQTTPFQPSNDTENEDDNEFDDAYGSDDDVDVVGRDESYIQVSPDKHSEAPSENAIEPEIVLYRYQGSFGFAFTFCDTKDGRKALVGQMQPGGAASMDGKLQIGDEIIGVNGTSIVGLSVDQSIELVKKSNPSVRIKRIKATAETTRLAVLEEGQRELAKASISNPSNGADLGYLGFPRPVSPSPSLQSYGDSNADILKLKMKLRDMSLSLQRLDAENSALKGGVLNNSDLIPIDQHKELLELEKQNVRMAAENEKISLQQNYQEQLNKTAAQERQNKAELARKIQDINRIRHEADYHKQQLLINQKRMENEKLEMSNKLNSLITKKDDHIKQISRQNQIRAQREAAIRAQHKQLLMAANERSKRLISERKKIIEKNQQLSSQYSARQMQAEQKEQILQSKLRKYQEQNQWLMQKLKTNTDQFKAKLLQHKENNSQMQLQHQKLEQEMLRLKLAHTEAHSAALDRHIETQNKTKKNLDSNERLKKELEDLKIQYNALGVDEDGLSSGVNMVGERNKNQFEQYIDRDLNTPSPWLSQEMEDVLFENPILLGLEDRDPKML